MSLLYKVSDKELVKLRNDVFRERGIPALTQNGFVGSPFSASWFGKDDMGGYTYHFCRISDESRLDIVIVYIVRGDRWVQLHLNIFKLHPKVESIGQLKGEEGLQFLLPPNSASLTRLVPPRRIIYWPPKHKVRFFFSRAGLNKRLLQLGNVIEHDLKNIDSFIIRWMNEHEIMTTAWNGCAISDISKE